MANEKQELLTAGKIAQELGISGAVVSKTIKALNIQPTMKKGACSYYSKDVIKKIKAAAK